ncbi:hypothetical protein CZ794_04675 [Psychrobacter sp. JB385]|nr:hypothetical protein CZ794_04675 [Psychrobacter sp. JB385]
MIFIISPLDNTKDYSPLSTIISTLLLLLLLNISAYDEQLIGICGALG